MKNKKTTMTELEIEQQKLLATYEALDELNKALDRIESFNDEAEQQGAESSEVADIYAQLKQK